MLVNSAEIGLDVTQGRLQDAIEDAALFVAKERFQRVHHARKMTIEQADQFRNVGSREDVAGLLNQSLVGAGTYVFPHSSGQVVIPEMEHGEAQVRVLPGDPRKDLRVSHNELRFSAETRLVI